MRVAEHRGWIMNEQALEVVRTRDAGARFINFIFVRHAAAANPLSLWGIKATEPSWGLVEGEVE